MPNFWKEAILNIFDRNLLAEYDCEAVGLERIYHLNFKREKINLRFTTPISYQINDFYCEAKSWTDFIIAFVSFLSEKCNLLKFRPSWTESCLFTLYQVNKRNDVQIKQNLFLNYSTAINHLFEFIRDLLLFSGYKLSETLIKYRSLPQGEPKEIRNHVIRKMKEGYQVYLSSKGFSDDDVKNACSYIHTVNNHIKPILDSAYDNIYLISDKHTLYNTKYKFIDVLKNKTKTKLETIDNIQKQLDLYYEYFCFIDEWIGIFANK